MTQDITTDADTAYLSDVDTARLANIDTTRLYDAIIIGGGPAGLTAALYLARARYRVLVLEKNEFGGQITITAEVANYPGAARTSGRALTETMRAQAAGFGAEFLLAEVSSVDLDDVIKTVHTERGDLFCLGLILATGAHPRTIGFIGEEEFQGRGVAYCATCDGEFFSGLDIFVVGGGLSAAQEALFLTKFARRVIMLVRGEQLRAPQSVVEQIETDPDIEIHFNSVVEEVAGTGQLEILRYRDRVSDTVHEYRPPAHKSFGVFVFAGYEPSTALVKGLLDLDEAGYVRTDANRKTSVDGVYAAGDVCIKNLRQVVTAVADGAIAATEMEHWAAEAQKRTGLTPLIPQVPTLSPEEDGTDTPVEEASLAQGANDTQIAGSTCAFDTESGEGAGRGSSGSESSDNDASFFDEDMHAQLHAVFSRMARPVIMEAILDDRPVSAELQAFLKELAGMTDKLSLVSRRVTSDEDSLLGTAHAPFVELRHADGRSSGVVFHGVPGGHETTSFILAIYNVSGPGQALAPELADEIAALSHPTHLTTLVSLSCTNCPDVVQATQRIAALNPLVRAEAYDLRLYPDLQKRYKVMSVPCLIIEQEGRDEQIVFGKRQLPQILKLLG